MNGAFNRIAEKADLPKIRVHDGRHTFAVRSRQAGLSLEDIKDFLGHKDISTTQIYAHISPEVKKGLWNSSKTTSKTKEKALAMSAFNLSLSPKLSPVMNQSEHVSFTTNLYKW